MLKLKKKHLAIFIALVMVFALAACGNNDPAPPPPPPADNGEAERTYHVITAGHSFAEVTQVHHYFVVFAEELYRLSDGRITTNIFSAGALGADRELLEAVQAGDVQLMAGATVGHVAFAPDLAIFDMMFIHDSLEQARRWIDDPDFMTVLREVYSDVGFHILGFGDAGFRYLTANIPVRTPADLGGFTLRASANELHIATWQAMGANPTPMPITEVYMALHTGVVDGQENPIVLNYGQRFYETQAYSIEINHFYQMDGYIMCPVFYNSLPPELQAAVDQASDIAIASTRQWIVDNNERMIQHMKDAGVTFITLTPEEVAPFRVLAEPVWETIRAQVDPRLWDAHMTALDRSR